MEHSIDLSDLSDKDLLRTAEYVIDSNAPGGIKQTIVAAQNELSSRIRQAETRLWEARMEIQHAENAVRRLTGFMEKEVRGVSGKLNED